jgi:hypothetical protein
LTLLILPLARLKLSLNVYFGALFEVLLDHSTQTLTKDHYRMPLGPLAPLSRRLVAPGIRCRNPQVGDRTPILRAPNFRISAEITEQEDLIYASGHVRPPFP